MTDIHQSTDVEIDPEPTPGGPMPVRDRRYLDDLVIDDGHVRLLAADQVQPAEGGADDLDLGRIAERPGAPGCWGFTTDDRLDPAIDGSRLYRSDLAAAKACALQALEGVAARATFDATELTGRPPL